MAANVQVILGLQDLCLVKVSSIIWGRTVSRSEVVRFVQEKDLRCEYVTSKRNWEKMAENIFPELPIPQELNKQVRIMYCRIGRELYSWIEYLILELKYEKQLVEFYNFSCTGCIDWPGTIQNWRNNCVDPRVLFELACLCCLEDVIFDLYPYIELDDVYEHVIYGEYRQHLTAYWMCNIRGELDHLFDNMREHRGYQVKIYDESHSYAVNMLKLSLSEGWYLAFKYFWDRLSEPEKLSNLNLCLSVARSRDYLGNNGNYSHILFIVYPYVIGDPTKSTIEILMLHSFRNYWPLSSVVLKRINTLCETWTQNKILLWLTEMNFSVGENDDVRNLFVTVWSKCSYETKESFARERIMDILFYPDPYFMQLLIHELSDTSTENILEHISSHLCVDGIDINCLTRFEDLLSEGKKVKFKSYLVSYFYDMFNDDILYEENEKFFSWLTKKDVKILRKLRNKFKKKPKCLNKCF